MAQKITVVLEDDLDGGPADETVWFAVDGAAYEIDLSTKHAKALRSKLEPFISQARKAGPGAQRGYPGVGESPWHRGQRSRAHPASVTEQYQAAAIKGT